MTIESTGVLKTILAHLKPSVRTVAAFAIFYLIFLAVPNVWEGKGLALKIFGDLILIVHALGAFAICYLLTFPIHSAWELIGKSRGKAFSKKYLTMLSPREKLILSLFVNENRKSVNLDYADGDVQMLEMQGILIRLATVSRGGTRFDYNIQPWAYLYLNAKPNLLTGASERLSSEDDNDSL